MKCIEEEDLNYHYLEMFIGDHNWWEGLLVMRHSRFLIVTYCAVLPIYS